jgi:NitT/TauT family transport system substrate-binding protein
VKQIRIGYLSTTYHTSFILMGTPWIKKKMNVETMWRLFPTGPEMIKAFEKSELDIGYVGLPPAIMGVDRGLRIQCVGGGHMEGTVLVARKGYETLKRLRSLDSTLNQFKGKTIGTPTQGSIHDIIIRNLLAKSGLQRRVAVRNFEWADEILEAMEDGEIQGGVGTPPLAVLAMRLFGAVIVLHPHVMWPNNPSYGIVTTTETIEDSPSMLREFLKLHEKACNLIREKPDEAAIIAAKTLGMVDKDFVLRVYRVSPKYCASLSKEYVDSTMSFMPFLKKLGYISHSVETADIFQTDFIRATHPRKPHYDDPGMLA